MLYATKCFKKKVVAKDKDLGIFVNLVFDRENCEARMVVFPELKTKRQGVLKSLGSIGSRAFSSVSYDLSSEIGSTARGVLTDVVYEATRKLDQREYNQLQKLTYLYFLLPVSEITKVTDEEIILDKSSEDYDIYMSMKGTKSDAAFFNNEMLKESSRYMGISLNLTAVRGLSLKDAMKKKGRIIDVVFHPKEGTLTHFVLTTIEEGIKRRYIPAKIIDLKGMTVSKPFLECPVELTS